MESQSISLLWVFLQMFMSFGNFPFHTQPDQLPLLFSLQQMGRPRGDDGICFGARALDRLVCLFPCVLSLLVPIQTVTCGAPFST